MSHTPRVFRYLPRNPSDTDWGALVLDAGHGNVPPGSEYPLPGHTYACNPDREEPAIEV